MSTTILKIMAAVVLVLSAVGPLNAWQNETGSAISGKIHVVGASSFLKTPLPAGRPLTHQIDMEDAHQHGIRDIWESDIHHGKFLGSICYTTKECRSSVEQCINWAQRDFTDSYFDDGSYSDTEAETARLRMLWCVNKGIENGKVCQVRGADTSICVAHF